MHEDNYILVHGIVSKEENKNKRKNVWNWGIWSKYKEEVL